jgi:hypothetical protein
MSKQSLFCNILVGSGSDVSIQVLDAFLFDVSLMETKQVQADVVKWQVLSM